MRYLKHTVVMRLQARSFWAACTGVPFLTAGQRTPYGVLRKLTRPFRI
jgi:hypothetical protein